MPKKAPVKHSELLTRTLKLVRRYGYTGELSSLIFHAAMPYSSNETVAYMTMEISARIEELVGTPEDTRLSTWLTNLGYLPDDPNLYTMRHLNSFRKANIAWTKWLIRDYQLKGQ